MPFGVVGLAAAHGVLPHAGSRSLAANTSTAEGVLPHAGSRSLAANTSAAEGGAYYTHNAADLCPEPDFRAALDKVAAHLPYAVYHAGGADAVVSNFLANHFGSEYGCMLRPTKAWPRSTRRRGLYINAADGTTGTRFVVCVLDALGLNAWAGHNMDGIEGCTSDCTAHADGPDVLSDQPVPNLLTQLLTTHQGQLTLGVLLSLRDPDEWVAARGAFLNPSTHGAATCGYSPSSMSDARAAALHHLTYNAFAACLATSARLGFGDGHLFAFNLFAAGERDAAWAARLAQWLRRRPDPRFADLSDERAIGAAARCSEAEAASLMNAAQLAARYAGLLWNASSTNAEASQTRDSR